MKKIVEDFKVLKNIRLNPEHYVLVLKAPADLPDLLPGQFVEAFVENAPNTFLRRPFSIHDVDYDLNTISLLIQRVGQGSRFLSYLEPGDFLNLVFPLGNGFSAPVEGEPLLVGGGCGVAPLLFLARWLREQDFYPTILLGARSEEFIMEINEFKRLGKVIVSTNDGSLGEKGFVTEHSVFKNDDFPYKRIYTCGPDPMMKAVARLAEEKKVDCDVSLENTMACGIGACLCCVVDTVRGNECVCTEGPVFNAKELKW